MTMFLLFLLSCLILPVYGQSTHGMSEPEQLGISAGLAAACNSEKLADFEVIASRIIANKALTEAQELEDDRTYITARIDTQRRHQKAPQMSCREILNHFNKLPIFNAVVYSDGSVKMPDGTLLKPRRPIKKKQ